MSRMNRFRVIFVMWHEHFLARQPDYIYRFWGLIGTTLELLLTGTSDEFPEGAR